ncbi:MAG: hypothetical protein MUO40_12150, partial [Anaerolineaceae bacterium]|nr:hypothetical protein [Anaerolineaceae bacterium]
IDKVRQEKKPHALIIDTIRFSAHSKGDDTRSETDMAVIRTKRDPLTIHAQKLSAEERKVIEVEVQLLINQSFQSALETKSTVRVSGVKGA